MVRHILTGVSLALLVLFSVTLAEDLSSNKQLVAGRSPYKSDLAYEFFNIGSLISPEFRNVTISTHKTYDDSQCDIDIEAIMNGLHNYDEWAIECKHLKSNLNFTFVFIEICNKELKGYE